MSNQVFGVLTSIFIFALFATPFAWGANILAEKLGKSRWLWMILTLIPGVNCVFAFFAALQVVFHVLDGLKDVRAAVVPPAEEDPSRS